MTRRSVAAGAGQEYAPAAPIRPLCAAAQPHRYTARAAWYCVALPTSTWTVSYGLLISTVELLGYESVVVSVARRLSFWAFGRIHGDLSVRETFGYACVSGVACAPRLHQALDTSPLGLCGAGNSVGGCSGS